MTAERSNMKFSYSENKKLGEYQAKIRKSVNLAPIYFDQVENYINNRIEDLELREKVMKIAKKYPHSALSKFISNFSKILTDCQKQINIEKNIDTQKRVIPPQAEITVENLMDIHSALDDEWLSEQQKDLQNDANVGKIQADQQSSNAEDLQNDII